MRKVYYRMPVVAGLLSMLSMNAFAQFNFGTATGNWSGTQGLYLNPAIIADSRERFTIDIISANAGVDNNLGSLNNKGGIIGALNDGSTDKMFTYNGSSTFSVMAPYARVNGPGCMISINHRHSIALTTAVRGMNQFNNFDRSLYETITNPAYLPSGDATYTSHNYNYTAHMWSELGASYAGVILDAPHHEIRVGATLRYLGGIGYVGLKGQNLNVQYRNGNDTVYAYNSDIQYASNISSAKGALFNGFANNNLFTQFFGTKAGGGLGADFGIVYDYIDGTRDVYEMDGMTDLVDRSANIYRLRMSASVLDLGAITYKSNNNSNLEASGNGYLTGAGLSNSAGNFSDFKNYITAQGFDGDSTHKNTRVGMPTRMLFSVDYNAYKHFYINTACVINIANRQNFGNSYYNQVTVTPRYDTRLISVGLPITYSLLSNSMKMGVGFRVSGFFVGSDDLLGLFASQQYGFNAYVGGFVPFYKLRRHDRDGDRISDCRDHCPDEPGDMESNGCPFGKDHAAKEKKEAKEQTEKKEKKWDDD